MNTSETDYSDLDNFRLDNVQPDHPPVRDSLPSDRRVNHSSDIDEMTLVTLPFEL